MKPRVFVSSTYYDLKHVRERIEKFIENYGFESVLFESDKVTYEHGKPIDDSAYNEVTLCHLMVLIVGGRYGTSATSSNKAEEQKKYENEYVSITRKEFETALVRNIPVFIFIDKNVFSEYQTYKANQEFFDNNDAYKVFQDSKEIKFKFAHVDNANVFRFIDLIKAKPIKTFDKVEEVEIYLQNQIAGLFYLYLDGLQKQNEVNKVLDTVAELNNISLRMNEMLNSVGKKILGNENEEYETVIKKQFEMIIDFFADQFFEMIEVEETSGEISENQKDEITELIFMTILDIEIKFPDKLNSISRRKWRIEHDENLVENLNAEIVSRGIPLVLGKVDVTRMNSIYHSKVKPFISNEENRVKLIDRLRQEIGILI
ncbi:DUF4062 domain-containing protein [Arcicella rosea]|uniref:DUF4062 domain-containing protein n=1 Tax=Arcicella rosea TaxID=502909 RepID=A0A841ES39_9BACT|nr:DUF4062 domain-containing protein [Arcicella rosea]MBB6005756.1 hypothetical protein [Arcicella rosea]